MTHSPTFLLILISFLTSSFFSQAQQTLTPIGKEAHEVMQQFFAYDKGIPLNPTVVAKVEEAEYVREKIVFNGIHNNRVPGYLAIPKSGEGPYPCVLLLHGIGSSKEDWWKDDSFLSGGLLTKQLLAAGYAVLMLDAEYHGERLANNDFESPEVFTFQKGWFLRARDMIVQSAIEYRRGIDYLATRTDIDTARIGIVGYSMGGMMAFSLNAIDPRIKTTVASVTPVLKEPHSAMAVYNFAPYIKNQSFLMLMGKADNRNYSEEEAQQLYNLIESPSKDLFMYESGHKLPKEWAEKATMWIKKYL